MKRSLKHNAGGFPGETQKVTLNIIPDALAFYDKEMQWMAEPGDFTIMVGTASNHVREIKLRVEE